MRRTIAILLTSLMLLAPASGLAHADGMILPLPESLDSGYLAVRYHHVEVRIEDGHAVTRVEQEFYNPHDVPVRGRYLFPIPPDAILSNFEATVDGRPQTAVRQDATQTNTDLYNSVSQQRDPSLLQYTDWESFAFDLDLPPGGARTMRLEYEEVLVPGSGLYRYRYVLSTERYSLQPLDEVSITVDVFDSSGLASVYSPSHEVAVERLGAGRTRVQWQAAHASPDQDFELFFAPAEAGYGAGLLTGRRHGQDHFLLLFSPDLEPRQTKTLPKDIVFVIDRSGSMSGDKIEQARGALHFILDQLGEKDRFSIVAFDDRISLLDENLQSVGQQTVRDAHRFVDRLSADGATDLEAALQAGLEVLARGEARGGSRGATRMVVFLTDGLPTAGIQDEGRIARRIADTNARLEARMHVFGVGYDVNSHLLDQLAASNRGSVTYVQPGENLEAALTGFYNKIAQPLLTDLEITFEGLETNDVYPQHLPDLFQGSSLVLSGRFGAEGQGQSAIVRVRGRAGGEVRGYVYRFALDEIDGHDFVPRLWATRRVGDLLDQVRVEGEHQDLGERQALVDEIRDLGLGYGIVTPYTTAVIEGQSQGVASAENMDLYNRSDLNAASGETTIRARVQNQAYQQAGQADLATGANVANYGQQSLARMGGKQVDLALLRDREDINGLLTSDWVERYVEVDRSIEFGSEAYFALAADPEARPFLQSGTNVVFEHGEEIIAIHDGDTPVPEPDQEQAPGNIKQTNPDAGVQSPRLARVLPGTIGTVWNLLAGLVPVAIAALVLSLASAAAIVYAVLRYRPS